MRPRSLHHRLQRYAERRSAADMELAFYALAGEYGVDPDEVRAHLENNAVQIRRFAHLTTDEFVRCCAAELAVSEEDLRAEVARAQNAVCAAIEVQRRSGRGFG